MRQAAKLMMVLGLALLFLAALSRTVPLDRATLVGDTLAMACSLLVAATGCVYLLFVRSEKVALSSAPKQRQTAEVVDRATSNTQAS